MYCGTSEIQSLAIPVAGKWPSLAKYSETDGWLAALLAIWRAVGAKSLSTLLTAAYLLGLFRIRSLDSTKNYFWDLDETFALLKKGSVSKIFNHKNFKSASDISSPNRYLPFDGRLSVFKVFSIRGSEFSQAFAIAGTSSLFLASLSSAEWYSKKVTK